MRLRSAALRSVAGLLFAAAAAFGAVYEVGPGQPLATIGAVPWASLAAGDVVRIHWRAEPYREKWVIAAQGTTQSPVVVQGVAGPSGQTPVIEGADAVTAQGLNYWSETRGIVKIGGSNTPADQMPRYIVVEGLEFRGANDANGFTDDSGSPQTYDKNASGIYLEKGENITIRNCVFTDSGNGLFVASSDAQPSRDILIQGNYFHGNGNVGSAFEHNTYTAALGIVFEYNRYGPPRAGSIGNSLKDRSAGTVIRYNWIEGGNRQLDLVDAEDSSAIRADPTYDETFVYGNILIEPAGAGNRQITHYGGDSGATGQYRKGVLYFYNNTVVSTRTDRNTMFRLSTNDETCDARNNVFYTTLPGSDLSLLAEAGVLDLTNNWIKPGWRNSFDGGFAGTVTGGGTGIEGAAPGFVNEASQDFRPAAESALIDAGVFLHAVPQASHDILMQYVEHRAVEPRADAAMPDLGAFAASLTAPSPAALSGQTAGGTVTLSWTYAAPTDGFLVVRGVRAMGVWWYAAAAILGPSAASFIDADRSPGQYVYLVIPYRDTDDTGIPGPISNPYETTVD